MDAAKLRTSQFATRLQRFAALTWNFLRNPRLTAGLIITLVVVSGLGLLIPQQIAPASDASAWISTLPPLVQPWGEPLFFLGFARIFQSVWFWLPAALLLLNSLVALADYGPGSWQRLGKTLPPVEWQHPLARRAEQIVRLPKSPTLYLGTLRTLLEERGFFLYQAVEPEQRTIGAVWRGRAWLGLVALYAGLLVLVAALLVSHYSLKTGWLTLLPLEPRSNSLFQGQFELVQFDAESGLGQITYTPKRAEQPSQQFNWRLYRPTFFKKTLILPLASNPILAVEVRDSTNALLRLIPVQQDLAAAERLNLPLDKTGSPLYFLIPSVNLAVQILPEPASPQHYNVQARRGSEAAPSENITVSAGQTFQIDDLFITLSLDHSLMIWTHYDLALPLYLVSAILLVVASIFTWWRPPLQLWLIPEVKGLGGQLYGVVETLGPLDPAIQFLKALLAEEGAQMADNRQASGKPQFDPET